jgi:hypothetical protein
LQRALYHNPATAPTAQIREVMHEILGHSSDAEKKKRRELFELAVSRLLTDKYKDDMVEKRRNDQLLRTGKHGAYPIYESRKRETLGKT